MTALTQRTFDFSSLTRCLETWDVDALLALYDDEVEFIQVDKKTPPSSPRILRGKQALAELYRDIASRGLETRVGDVIAGPDRFAFAVTCRYPTGGSVYEHTMIDVRDGKIVRQVGVEAWDE